MLHDDSKRYPRGAVRALLATDRVTAATREALQMKLAPAEAEPAFFGPEAFAILRAVCARLVPQTGPDRVDIAARLDGRLARGERNGWRYALLPHDAVAIPAGLNGLDETAAALFDRPFVTLGEAQQDRVLRAVERGDPPGATWAELPAFYWFEELLVEVVEIFYAHPFGQEEIGYVGMADAHGWSRLGLNELEDHEPRPLPVAEALHAAS